MRSALLSAARLGEYLVRRYTGEHRPDGEPRWTGGDLLVESIYRFKGQSAAGIVLSELDFAELSQKERRKLFVGFTRAHLAVEMVLSQSAEQCLARAFQV